MKHKVVEFIGFMGVCAFVFGSIGMWLERLFHNLSKMYELMDFAYIGLIIACVTAAWAVKDDQNDRSGQ